MIDKRLSTAARQNRNKTLDCAGAHFVVRRNRFNPAQELFRFGLEDRDILVRTRKPLHRLQRNKEVHHHELDFVRFVSAKNIRRALQQHN